MENKSNKKASILKGAILTGVIASLTPLSANSSALFSYDVLGSGAEVRTQILEEKSVSGTVYELKCGSEKEESKKKSETKKGEATKAKKGKSTEAKCGEGKCGEGKCGSEKKEGKSEEKKEGESKSTEAKCGEGKCGVE